MLRQLLIIIIIALLVVSCNDNTSLNKYNAIIQQADKIEIFYAAKNKGIVIPQEQLADFKDILTRNVSPTFQRKFKYDVSINVYKNNQQTGALLIANGDKGSFVNFKSDSLNFGFRLTYGIGQTIDEISPKKTYNLPAPKSYVN